MRRPEGFIEFALTCLFAGLACGLIINIILELVS